MDKRQNLVENFEEILKQHTSKKPTRLYDRNKDEKQPDFRRKSYNPKDIIRNISAQIKAIQNADCMTSRSVNKVLEKHKTSNFVPLNKLQAPVVPQTKAAKFETQFVLDTQLINLIEDVEDMSSHKGITQEFESTFDHTNIELMKNRLKPPDDKVATCVTNSESHNSKSVISSPNITVNIIDDNKANSETSKDSKELQPIIDINQDEDTQNNKKYEIANNKASMDDHCTALLDRCMEIEENIDIQDVITDTEINPSPNININRVNKSNSTISPLVFNLDSFEKFEKIALPIIEENYDIDTVKHLINSQIIGKELFIQTDFEPELSKSDESLSPVLKITKTPKINPYKENYAQPSTSKCIEFKDNITQEKVPASSTYNEFNLLGNTLDNFTDAVIKDSANKQEKKSVSFEDEILFSSDEENDIKEANIQDLPFTCALETSFYDHSDVLDTTMYVGFQTASNKSIQVSTVSFSKAKSILDDEIENKIKVPTLKELVERCDTPKAKITFISGNTVNNNDSKKKSPNKAEGINLESEVVTVHDNFVGFKTAIGTSIEVSDKNTGKVKSLFSDIDKDADNNNPLQDNIKFDGFKTASNKNINLSKKALQRCKRVFQDIDLEDNICDDLPSENKPCAKRIRHSLEQEKAFHDDLVKSDEKEICDPDIPKIDENILQEFEGETFDDNKDDGVNQLIGFETASNKNTAFSDTALEKSKKIFDNTDFAEISNTNIKQDDVKIVKEQNLNTKHINIGFKTAGNKLIKISEKAFAKTKSIFQDIDMSDAETKCTFATASINDNISKVIVNDDTTLRKNKPIDTNFVGFKTASNKKIKISEEAITKTKNIFQDIDLDEPNNEYTGDKIDDELIKIAENIDFNRPSTSKDNCVGFRTANNKKIHISDAAIDKSKNIFQDLDNLHPDKNTHTEEFDVIKLIEDRKLTEEFDKDFKVSSDVNESEAKNDTIIIKNRENSESSNHNKFYGFQTAGNKPVKVSKEALVKSQALFQDILVINEKVEPEKTGGFVGFHTASNKKIRISDAALERSKKLFEELDIQKNKNNVQGIQRYSTETVAKSRKDSENISEDAEELNDIQLSPVFKGFQIASKNEVKVSDAALAKSRKIFDDLDASSKELNEAGNIDRTPVFKGFQTASNKKVIISEQALAKSRKLFEDIDTNIEKIYEKEKNYKTPTFKGFQAASSKKVMISEQALARSRMMFEDIDKSNVKVNQIEKNNRSPVFKGFQTASNKNIVISEQALAKSKELFKDINKDAQKDEEIEKYLKTPVFKGFQTASNKQVKISAAALAKSKKIFEDFDTVTEDNTQISQVIMSKSDLQCLNRINKDTSTLVGFQTASNKEVKISSVAIEKSKKIFEDIDFKDNDIQIVKNTKPTFVGFQTANNKKVKVSSEALARSKKIFEGLENDNEDVTNLNSLFPDVDKSDGFTVPLRGFNTASNKEVKISTDALAASKKIFQDLNDFKENKAQIQGYDKEINSFRGFHTGSNKKVVISEDALARSRQILSDIKVNKHSRPFAFKTANNNIIQVSEEAISKSKQLLTETDELPSSCVIKLKTYKQSKTKPDINLDKLIDTQVIKNFDESLNTEDFRSPENRSKRSGSPILSCPRAKKRKFATPYKIGNIHDGKTDITKDIEIYDDSYKKHKKYTLKDIAKLESNRTNSEINTDIDINAMNLANFEFTAQRNDISNTKMSLGELKEIFLKSVNKKLVPDGWFENHVKLILWKLLSYEVKFPKTMSGVCSAQNVLLQLKYRYRKELYSAERPALRKILERDDVASKMLVLCVMEIYKDGGDNSATNPPELLLTDGWYSIRSCTDKMLARHISDGKIKVGTKMVTHGAELVNCEQGVAPWEDTSSVRLKIFGNSTRRARWDARLGYYSGRSGMVCHLSGLKPEGGKVSSLCVLVTRVYPPLYVEKFEDGSTVTRSERLEHIHQMKYEADRQALVEKIYEEVEAEMSHEESPDAEDIDISKRSLESGSQIARLLKMSKEPSQFRANLTESQRRLLEAYSVSKRDKLLEDIQERIRSKLTVTARNVVPLLKIRVAEIYNGKIDKALLSIWKPNDALAELITEGAYIEILNVVPTAIRYSELQLSAGRQTIFKQSKKIPENLQPYIKNLNRTCYRIKDIISHPNMITDYNEIDTVGMIIQIDPSHQDFKNINQFQNVYLTDEEKNIICVNFWGGIKKFGFENVLDTGQMIACVNLQKRAGNTRKNIPQYRATEFTYFTKTPRSIVARKLVEELTKKVAKNKGFIQECLVVKNNLLKSNVSYEISPYRFHNHDLSKNKIYIESPLARIQPKIQDEFNLSGLDFESTFRQTEPQELSPKSLLRKKKLNEKISKLKMYGEPPPLSPINIINKSKNATKSFKSPLLNTSVASKCVTPVASVKNLPENTGDSELNCSPLLVVNRTFKRIVNPVKLNFNNAMEENDSVDHFAEEFDASPPLSLD